MKVSQGAIGAEGLPTVTVAASEDVEAGVTIATWFFLSEGFAFFKGKSPIVSFFGTNINYVNWESLAKLHITTTC